MPLLHAIAQQSLATISELNRQELAMTAWAFATLGVRNQPLFTSISAEAIRKMSAFGPLEVSNLAWAFARLAERDETLMSALSAAAIKTLHDSSDAMVATTGNELANPAGAYALVWAAWKFVWPQLCWSIFEQPPPHSPTHEPLVYGMLLMDCEWNRDRGTAAKFWPME
mmetsp:Transcript_71047/g.111203  ORF Transcript_71047/g.111203 Transcript_71047/m.111203 type:complete len:169 (+) Transcript_71047:2-508(+)